jgi:hypothetical protein
MGMLGRGNCGLRVGVYWLEWLGLLWTVGTSVPRCVNVLGDGVGRGGSLGGGEGGDGGVGRAVLFWSEQCEFPSSWEIMAAKQIWSALLFLVRDIQWGWKRMDSLRRSMANRRALNRFLWILKCPVICLVTRLESPYMWGWRMLCFSARSIAREKPLYSASLLVPMKWAQIASISIPFTYRTAPAPAALPGPREDPS